VLAAAPLGAPFLFPWFRGARTIVNLGFFVICPLFWWLRHGDMVVFPRLVDFGGKWGRCGGGGEQEGEN